MKIRRQIYHCKNCITVLLFNLFNLFNLEYACINMYKLNKFKHILN